MFGKIWMKNSLKEDFLIFNFLPKCIIKSRQTSKVLQLRQYQKGKFSFLGLVLQFQQFQDRDDEKRMRHVKT